MEYFRDINLEIRPGVVNNKKNLIVNLSCSYEKGPVGTVVNTEQHR